MNTFCLFGFKGSGKTYLGKLLSLHLNLPFIDTDELISRKYGLPIRTLFQNVGEAKFRAIEREMVLEIAPLKSHIIALGGGAILDLENRRHLQTNSRLIYLKASFETVQKRIFKEGIPAFVDSKDPVQSLKKIYFERIPIYESIAAKCVDVDLHDELSCIHQIV